MLTLMISALILGSPGSGNATAYYKDKVREIAASAKIPLIQVEYKSGKKTISFESAQFEYAKESAKCNTIFQAASLSKPVFSYIVLKMADKGEIDLDKPLFHYTDIDRFTNKTWAKLLTARIVLSHRSGLPNWAASPSSDEWPSSQIEFKVRPDSCFGYSGEAYALLQRAVEKIRGKSLEEIATEDVFIPLRMTNTSYLWKDSYDSLAASGYNDKGENRGPGRFPGANSAYTLRTTAADYSKFLTALAKGTGLHKKTHREQFTPLVNAVYKSGNERPCDKFIFWGLGVGIEQHPELGNIIFHWGNNGNFKALFIIVPAQKDRPASHLVYFTNSYFGHDIINQIVPLFFNNKSPLQISDWIK